MYIDGIKIGNKIFTEGYLSSYQDHNGIVKTNFAIDDNEKYIVQDIDALNFIIDNMEYPMEEIWANIVDGKYDNACGNDSEFVIIMNAKELYPNLADYFIVEFVEDRETYETFGITNTVGMAICPYFGIWHFNFKTTKRNYLEVFDIISTIKQIDFTVNDGYIVWAKRRINGKVKRGYYRFMIKSNEALDEFRQTIVCETSKKISETISKVVNKEIL